MSEIATQATELSEDKKVLSVMWGQEMPFITCMSAEGAEIVINELALWRSEMLPDIPAKWESKTVLAHRDVAWSLETDSLAGDSLLHLRHPHFGWLHFIFSKSEAKRIGELLLAQANAEPPEAKGSA